MATPWKIVVWTSTAVLTVDPTDAGWQSIGLPHADDIQIPRLYYLETFDLPPPWQGRHLREEVVGFDWYWWDHAAQQIRGSNRISDVPASTGTATLWALPPAVATPGALKCGRQLPDTPLAGHVDWHTLYGSTVDVWTPPGV